jgi:hypothetical protein
MKLTEEQVKNMIVKAYLDLNWPHDNRYPIKVSFHKKDEKDNRHKMDYWAGRYDYSVKIPGINPTTHVYDSFSVDDEKGVVISLLLFPDDSPIKLDENGKYIWGK